MKSIYTKLLSIILISCLGGLVYSNTFHCSFHFDDEDYIINNFAIKNLHNLQNIWKFCPCRFVTFLSFAFNYHCHQLDVFGYHLFNITVHIGSAILVWWLTLLTFSTPAVKENKITQQANLMALLAGLVFVSHPLQTEAVTYIWQRAASMAAFFYLLSLSLYVKSRLLHDHAKYPWKFYYIGSLTATVAAMFTKENTITLPLMILLYEFSFFKPKKNHNWKYLIPFLLTMLIIPLTMLLTQSNRFQEIQAVVKGPGGISPMHYLLTQFRVMVTYIRLLFLPLNLNVDYDYPIAKTIFEAPVLISFLFLIAVLFCAKRLFLKYRLISFSIFWFYLTLIPESSLLPQKDVIFEHRLYLPMVGYSIFLVSGAYYLWGKDSIKTMMITLTIIISCYAVLTYQRNKVWRDEFTLWDDAVHKSPHKARPYIGCGIGYAKQDNFILGLSDFTKAIEIDPNNAQAYSTRGAIYGDQGNFSQAIADCTKAIAINPYFADAYNNRGSSYYMQGNWPQAIADFTKAIEINPDYADVYNKRGSAYYKQGNLLQAIADYTEAIKINPGDSNAYYNRAIAYSDQGNLPQVISDYTKAIEINPDDTQAMTYRAFAYYYVKEYDKAWVDVRKVEALGKHVIPKFINLLSQASENNAAPYKK